MERSETRERHFSGIKRGLNEMATKKPRVSLRSTRATDKASVSVISQRAAARWARIASKWPSGAVSLRSTRATGKAVASAIPQRAAARWGNIASV